MGGDFSIKIRPMNDRSQQLEPSPSGKLVLGDYIIKRNNKLLNYTDAGKWAKDLADMEVDGEQVISGEAFNRFVGENFPDVEFESVTNYISIGRAMDCFTTYFIKQQTIDKANQNAEKQEQSGQDSAPDMGV